MVIPPLFFKRYFYYTKNKVFFNVSKTFSEFSPKRNIFHFLQLFNAVCYFMSFSVYFVVVIIFLTISCCVSLFPLFTEIFKGLHINHKNLWSYVYYIWYSICISLQYIPPSYNYNMNVVFYSNQNFLIFLHYLFFLDKNIIIVSLTVFAFLLCHFSLHNLFFILTGLNNILYYPVI